MIGASFLSPRHVRRAALIVFVVSMALIILALLFGAEVKGSRRWILGVQPSRIHQAGLRRPVRLGLRGRRARRVAALAGKVLALPAAAG